MIPIGLPSLSFVLIHLTFIVATSLWMGWTIRLCLSAKKRQRLQGQLSAWNVGYVLLTGISLFTIWKVYDIQQRLAAYQAEQQSLFLPTLSEDQTLGTVSMPAGTALELAVPNQLASFRVARFPYPIRIGGVETSLAERYVSIQTNAAYQTTGYMPENIRLSGHGRSVQQGWICDAAFAITFSTHPDGGLKTFESCTLGAGNDVDGIVIPTGSEIVATTGTLYINGPVDPDRWLIHLPEKTSFGVGDSAQHGGALLLDAERKLFRQVPKSVQ